MSQVASQQPPSVNLTGSRHRNNRVSLLVRERPLVIYGLVANIIYTLGAICFVAFAALEFKDRERETIALIIYSISFVAFLANACGELYVDTTKGQRAVRHGRYSTNRYFNVVLSILFLVGTILDTIAFFLWIDRQFVTEHRVLYASSHSWLLAAILALVGQCPECSNVDAMEMLDDIGNSLFLVGTAIDCVVRYVDTDIESGSPPRPVAKLEFASSPFWLASAFCFTAADSLRARKIQQNRNCAPSSTSTNAP